MKEQNKTTKLKEQCLKNDKGTFQKLKVRTIKIRIQEKCELIQK